MGRVAFCRDSSGKWGVYCWDAKSRRLVSNYFRSLHDKQDRAYMSIVLILKGASAAAAAVGSGVETCGKTIALSVYVVGYATSIYSGCASC